ncbi:deoxyribodipyrimidine photo-lyase [Deinococcus reticulitermitis]|uniref:Deoxyribodipyrimidine photo-lyase n=1 Tax=Deinococcus reticulitermitis TaxID=856736 RepID=A0A1H6UJE4_9DEIO|nr:FAD-binding domain-containing protein [Deinococcus reticulitermitis]SEI88350.1 deoxyribodipyrimidine photo-lyase [Deinococcus reticulitermitis]
MSPPELPPSLRDVPPAELFPDVFARDPWHRGWTRGGHTRALELLAELDPLTYGRDRSYLDGHVSRLSAFLRHGVLTLAEVRDAALAHAPPTAPSRVWKYVNELSWRDFFVRVYAEVGDLVWKDFQPYKTGIPSDDYAREFPADIDQGTTGANCVDSWSRELRETGYLHNHVRMWFAAYIVHHRRVWWQGGASWFITHLLDGDPAANNLNWQWVASTWRSYPYIWNRGTLVKYAGERYCSACPLRDGGCPFDGTYAELSARLFPGKHPAPGETGWLPPDTLKAVPWEPPPTPEPAPDAVVWVHGDRLSPGNEALRASPGRPAVFVWDGELLKMWEVSAKRQTFIHECVQELPVHVLRGDVAEEVARFARHHGARTVATTPSPSPRFRRIVEALEAQGLTVQLWPEPVFAASLTPLDLTVHAKYWGQVSASAFGKPPAPPKEKPKVTVRAGGTPEKKARGGRRKKVDAEPLLPLDGEI